MTTPPGNHQTTTALTAQPRHLPASQLGTGPHADAETSWRALPVPMQESIQLAWQSLRAGNLGIGAVITAHNGDILARGRNCLIGSTPGEQDALSGTSIAHAEMNALAEIPFAGTFEHGLTLYTTLQPCLQCLGAITLSAVRHVHVLAPDPLYRGLERIRDVIYFDRARWPRIDQQPVTRWAVLTLLLRTYKGVTTRFGAAGWNEALPAVAALARSIKDSGQMAEIIRKQDCVTDVAQALWTELGDGLDDVRRVGAAASLPISGKTSPA